MNGCCYPWPQSTLTGVPTATLQQWLTDAQNALALLYTGQQPVSVSYSNKSVSYMKPDIAALTAWITMLQRQLGIVCARRAIVPVFR